MSAVGLEVIGVGFALLAPVYGLLFQIQRTIGRFGAELTAVEDKAAENEGKIEAYHS